MAVILTAGLMMVFVCSMAAAFSPHPQAWVVVVYLALLILVTVLVAWAISDALAAYDRWRW